MEQKEIIIKFLLDEVSRLNQENKRLNDTVLQLEADCYYYQEHWKPIEEKKRWKKKSDDDFMPF